MTRQISQGVGRCLFVQEAHAGGPSDARASSSPAFDTPGSAQDDWRAMREAALREQAAGPDSADTPMADEDVKPCVGELQVFRLDLAARAASSYPPLHSSARLVSVRPHALRPAAPRRCLSRRTARSTSSGSTRTRTSTSRAASTSSARFGVGRPRASPPTPAAASRSAAPLGRAVANPQDSLILLPSPRVFVCLVQANQHRAGGRHRAPRLHPPAREDPGLRGERDGGGRGHGEPRAAGVHADRADQGHQEAPVQADDEEVHVPLRGRPTAHARSGYRHCCRSCERLRSKSLQLISQGRKTHSRWCARY